MKKILFLILALFLISFVSAQDWSTNLLINPGAETGNTNGWVTDHYVAKVEKSDQIHSGSYSFTTAFYASGQECAWIAYIYQDVNLFSYATIIDEGRVSANIGAYNYNTMGECTRTYSKCSGNYDDRSRIRRYYLDAGKNTIGSVWDTGYIGDCSWAQRSTESSIPVGTRYIRLRADAWIGDCCYSQSFIDDAWVKIKIAVGTGAQACLEDSHCGSGLICKTDYDSSGKFCCNSGQCSHDGACFSNTTESGNYKCSSGTWKLKDGVSCTANVDCYSEYCVNNVCGPTGPYCGDNVCDTTENCPAENISCTDNLCYEPTCINGCGQTAVTSGLTDEACNVTAGCTNPPCKCDGSGNCVTAAPCVLNTVSIASKDCSTDCWTNNKIGVTITTTGNCPSTMFIQVDARDADAQCDIQFLNGDLQGINVTCTSAGCKNWTIPDMSNAQRDCEGEIVNAVAAALYEDAAHTNRLAGATSVSGSFEFKLTKIEDSDGDGIPDSEDDCPDNAGEECNDGCPLLDEDNDDYQESTTQCPNFDYCPEEGGTVDSDGCPIEEECFAYWDCSQTTWSSCVSNKMKRIGSCTHGVLPEGCSEADYTPPTEKTCEIVEEFPWFTNLNLILVVLILIGYYIFMGKKHNI